ncbi:hypothetical protein FRC09_003110 [Ceratobasidium sp. 395]|nr:hypothetical protein FRC09_003110 [Ceratobasidium sp. 395]
MVAEVARQLVDAFANQLGLVNPLEANDRENSPERKAAFDASDAYIKLYFGEFRLICLTHMETQLLLWRATAWQLHELLGFKREVQLPYFTVAPDSQIPSAFEQLVADIVEFGFKIDDKNIVDIRQGIKTLLEANTCPALLASVTALGPLIAKGWHHLLQTALDKHDSFIAREGLRLHLEALGAEIDGKAQPNLDEKIAEIKEKYEQTRHDIESTLKNSRLTSASTESWFLFYPNYTAEPVQVGGKTIDYTPDFVALKWIQYELGKTFLQAASNMADKYRLYPRPNSTHDRLAFHTAYYLLSQGQNEFNRYDSRFLGTVGFRERHHQTYLSLTDPGQGHVFGTTSKSSWMAGVIVHVEHLERPARSGMDAIESYRMPSVREFARVRLHAGTAAPTTSFVGRPLLDSSEFKWDFIKVVDTVSSACSSMFNLGGAECKIAMSRMKASEMVAYMRALRGHTLKNHRQYLSAAFNLNTPIIDDINGDYLEDKMKIGKRAIELAALGGFEKVTWDGAADTYPSVPTLQAKPGDGGQLSRIDAIKLVHWAHSVGLTTYFSAGFKTRHIKTAVYSGVDGIGIGGAQVIRGMDHTSGMQGEYQESRIEDLIAARDDAAKSTQGRAAKLLARLDQMFFEGSINTQEQAKRIELFTLLSVEPVDEAAIDAVLNDEVLKDTWRIDFHEHEGGDPEERGDGEKPWKGRANRLIHQRNDNSHPLLRLYGGHEADKNWKKFTASLQHEIDREGDIHSLYMSNQWKEMRRSYQNWVHTNDKNDKKLPKFFMGEIEVSLKLTPYGDPKSKQLVNSVV